MGKYNVFKSCELQINASKLGEGVHNEVLGDEAISYSMLIDINSTVQ